jgi:hypothetical protein
VAKFGEPAVFEDGLSVFLNRRNDVNMGQHDWQVTLVQFFTIPEEYQVMPLTGEPEQCRIGTLGVNHF